jgi:FkbM family methyltransferase
VLQSSEKNLGDRSVKIGRRDLGTFLARVFDPDSYKAVPSFFNVYDNPVKSIINETFSLGSYPQAVQVNTPIGKKSVELFSPSDFSTLNLIFCRQDYYVPSYLKTVVDVGSNIGLSTFYWLTRNPESFVYCYEPSPASYNRLIANLRDFEGRYEAHQAAVSDYSGKADFGIERSGVYSSLDCGENDVTEGREFIEKIECQVLHINEILEQALSRQGRVDVLKIDSEGHELRTIQAIDKSFWKHIYCLNTDCTGAAEYIPVDFKFDHLSSAERFYR